MIWGIKVPPGKDFTFRASSDDSQTISLASLDCRPVEGEGLNDEPQEKFGRSSLLIKSKDIFTVICTLDKHTIPQQKLDLVLGGEEHIILRVEGTGFLYLTGYGSAYPTTETVPAADSVPDATTNEHSEEEIGEDTGSEEGSNAMDAVSINVHGTSASSSPKSIIENHQEERSGNRVFLESTSSEAGSPHYAGPSTSRRGLEHSIKQGVSEDNTLNRMEEANRMRTHESVSAGNASPDDVAGRLSKNNEERSEHGSVRGSPRATMQQKVLSRLPKKVSLSAADSVPDATTNEHSEEEIGEDTGSEEGSNAMDAVSINVHGTSASSSPKSIIENHQEERSGNRVFRESTSSEAGPPHYAGPSTSRRGLEHSIKQGVSEDNTLNRMEEANRMRTHESVSAGNASPDDVAGRLSKNNEERSEHGSVRGSPRATMQQKVLSKLPKKVSLSACVFCFRKDDDELIFGKFYKVRLGSNERRIHHNCMYFSCELVPRLDESEGIQGFHPDDILAELNRAKRLKCSYCLKTGASIGCGVKKCYHKYHFPCGRENQAIFRFYHNYASLCSNHRPKQELTEDVAPSSNCPVCFDEVLNEPSFGVLKTPCCHDTFLHRDCLEERASSSGYQFRCPFCRNQKKFQREMLKFGINVQLSDDEAYKFLLGSTDKSCHLDCSCPKGNRHNTKQGDWQILMCDSCDLVGCHRRCGGLDRTSKEWTCPNCRSISSESPRVSRPMSGAITSPPLDGSPRKKQRLT